MSEKYKGEVLCTLLAHKWDTCYNRRQSKLCLVL
jgi:hypothetical protein